MNLFPFSNTWRETILLYRFLRYRKGFGVHSPFAFSFITKVIDERCGYYCYQDIELIRRQLIHKGNKLAGKDIKHTHGELLFRTVNYFKPKTLLQIGSPAGIASLYMTAYASDLKPLSLKGCLISWNNGVESAEISFESPVVCGWLWADITGGLAGIGTGRFCFLPGCSGKREEPLLFWGSDEAYSAWYRLFPGRNPGESGDACVLERDL